MPTPPPNTEKTKQTNKQKATNQPNNNQQQKIYPKVYHFQTTEVCKNPEQREKTHLTYRRTKVGIMPDFCSETTEARGGWNGMFKVLREKKTPPAYICLSSEVILLYPVRLSFKN